MYASETITLDRGGYTWCIVNLFGADITSWRIRNVEQLFTSTVAMYDANTPIRGGIQIVYPRHGVWKEGPHHGFARIMNWKVEQPPTRMDTGDIKAILVLEDDDFSRSMWNYRFRLSYRIVLMEKDLKLSMNITNTDQHFALYNQMVFHPYFRCPDVREVKIAGLLESDFHDKLISETAIGDAAVVKIYQNVDRVYMNTKKNSHVLGNIVNNRKIKIEKINCPDTVVWNPWAKKSRTFKDLEPNGYLKLVVVACGYARDDIKIPPGVTVNCRVSYKLLKEVDSKKEKLSIPDLTEGPYTTSSTWHRNVAHTVSSVWKKDI